MRQHLEVAFMPAQTFRNCHDPEYLGIQELHNQSSRHAVRNRTLCKWPVCSPVRAEPDCIFLETEAEGRTRRVV